MVLTKNKYFWIVKNRSVKGFEHNFFHVGIASLYRFPPAELCIPQEENVKTAKEITEV